MMSAVRERLELDPKTYPDGGVFVRNGFPLRFQVIDYLPLPAPELAKVRSKRRNCGLCWMEVQVEKPGSPNPKTDEGSLARSTLTTKSKPEPAAAMCA